MKQDKRIMAVGEDMEKKNKFEAKRYKYKRDMLEGIKSCTVFIGYILANGLDCIPNLPVPDSKQIICFCFKYGYYNVNSR